MIQSKIITSSILTFALAGLVLANVGVHAQTATTSPTTKTANAVANCDKITSRINDQISKYANNSKAYTDRFDGRVNKIQEIITKLESNSIEDAKLKTNFANLQSKVNKFHTDAATYDTALLNTKNYTCGKSEGEFRDALADARSKLVTVRQDAIDVNSFFYNTIKSDLQAIRSSIK